MKRVEITVERGDEGEVEALLNGFGFTYYRDEVYHGGSRFLRYVTLVPDDAVEELVKQVEKSIDTRKAGNSVALYDVAAYVSKYLDGRVGSAKLIGAGKGLEELTQPLERFLKPEKSMLAMVFISTVVALAGLLLDNPVIVIGAMLVSPLLGPVNAVVVNASLGRVRKTLAAELSILVLMLASLVFSLSVALALQTFTPLKVTGEILLRTKPTAVDILVALLLGAAGSMALAKSMAETLVGVAVAASLLPPAAAFGILAAAGLTSLSLNALALMLINLIGLQAGGLFTMSILGVQPRLYYERKRASKQRILALLILALMLLLLYTFITYLSSG